MVNKDRYNGLEINLRFCFLG